MSITDELREWTRNHTVNCSDNRIALVAIAERIDKKHDDELMQAKAVVLLDCISAADDFIELPKDADGKTIHLQDRMSWDNGTFNVHELNLTADGWTTWDELHGYTVRADRCRHHHEPTVEDVLEEFFGKANLPDGTQTRAEIIAEYAAKLRLAGEDE